jgi:hypothetical protein
MRVMMCAYALSVVACASEPNVVDPTDPASQDEEGEVGNEDDDSGGGDGSGGDGTGGGGGDGGGGGGPGYSQSVGPYFTTPMFWNRDVTTAAKAPNSDAMIASLVSAGGWGNSNRFTIDFTIDVVTATAGSPQRSFTPTSDFVAPDCDNVPVPLPAGGNIEGNTGYACTNPGDCHLIVHDPAAGTLHEMWRANVVSSSTFYGGCLAVWNTTQAYDDELRGDQCTSADAAGFPIAPLLINADEVASGEIKHAIRLVLPNNRVKKGFVRPATHGSNTTGGASAPPYGVHMRLRADYPVASLPTAGARVVARAMQTYGMYHADGGQVALTAQSDRHTTAKWTGLLGPQDLVALKVSDFEVVDHGAMIPLTYECAR